MRLRKRNKSFVAYASQTKQGLLLIGTYAGLGANNDSTITTEGRLVVFGESLLLCAKVFRWAGLLVSGNGEVACVVIIYYIYRLYKKEPSPSPQKARLMPRTIRTIPTNNDRLIFTDFGI